MYVFIYFGICVYMYYILVFVFYINIYYYNIIYCYYYYFIFYFGLDLISSKSNNTLSLKTYPAPLTTQHLTLCTQPKTKAQIPRPPKTLMLILDLNPTPI